MHNSFSPAQYRDLPILFIIGTGRCGSSLIHELIARHRDAAFVSNIDDNLIFLDLKGRLNNLILRSPLGRFTKKGRLRFAPSEAYNVIARRVTPLYKTSHRNLLASDVTPAVRSGFERFFGERLASQSKMQFVHKYTGWSRAGFFKEIFPRARFVHIVRDGRAVANSFLQMSWWSGYGGPSNWQLGPLSDEDDETWRASDQSHVVLAGLAWKTFLESIETDFVALPDCDRTTIRYEDFIDDPTANVRRICDFAELSWDEDMVHQMDKSPIRGGCARSYREDLSESQVCALQDAIGQKLSALGYAQ